MVLLGNGFSLVEQSANLQRTFRVVDDVKGLLVEALALGGVHKAACVLSVHWVAPLFAVDIKVGHEERLVNGIGLFSLQINATAVRYLSLTQ